MSLIPAEPLATAALEAVTMLEVLRYICVYLTGPTERCRYLLEQDVSESCREIKVFSFID